MDSSWVHRGTVYSSLRKEGPVRDADARLPGRIRANKRPIEASRKRLRGSTVHEVAGMSALRAQSRSGEGRPMCGYRGGSGCG